MKANTSICLMLAAISVLLLREESTTAARRRVARGFAVIIAFIGIVTLSEHLFGWDAGIDQLLFRESVAEAGQSFPGRMGVAGSLNFTFLGLALLFLDTKPFGKSWGAHSLVLGVAGVTLLVFLYYFFGVEKFEPIAMYATIALHTVAAFLCLCVAILFARANRGIMGVLLQRADVENPARQRRRADAERHQRKHTGQRFAIRRFHYWISRNKIRHLNVS